MRTFIAIDLPREAINYIEELQGLIEKQNLITGKFTESENLHLTLKFLGEIDKEKVEEVKKRLKGIRFPAFEARLGDVGVFSCGKKSSMRVIWVELKGGVFNLQKQVDEALKGLFEPEFRFMSHITIARVKNVKDKRILLEYIKNLNPEKSGFNSEIQNSDFSVCKELKIDLTPSSLHVKKIKFKVDKFFLKKSELKPEGPVYEDIESYELSIPQNIQLILF